MAFGLPAIGTTAGAIPQLIDQGVNGYMIAPGDSAALSSFLRELSRNRGLLSQLSLNARRFFESRPTWDDSAEAIRRFLLQILGRSS